MKTISQIVDEILQREPFIWENLNDGLINASALARQIAPEVISVLGRDVNESAIMMAIRRAGVQTPLALQSRLKQFAKRLGDMTMRSNLEDFTFKNSSTLASAQAMLLNEAVAFRDPFITFSQGVAETTLIVSDSLIEEVNRIFASEELIQHASSLSSLTIRLPDQNSAIIGLYYLIFRNLAWQGINVVEVISTTNEFTIILQDDQIENAFKIFKEMRR
ncbi:MAG: aspartate kinase [Sphingobacteriia bacterium]|nr:aspartate kinase [Sphingobacteriia bacterium]